MHAAALQVNKADLLCDFCKMKDHDKEHCFAKRNAHAAAYQKAAKRRLTHHNNKKGGQQHTQETAAIPSTTQSVSTAYASELALDVSSPDLNGPFSLTKNYLMYFGPKHQSKHLAKHLRYFARYLSSKYLR
jgi:hypothetical protein